MIIADKAKPSFVISHEIELANAERAYEKFDKREDGYTKVIIHPNGGFGIDSKVDQEIPGVLRWEEAFHPIEFNSWY